MLEIIDPQLILAVLIAITAAALIKAAAVIAIKTAKISWGSIISSKRITSYMFSNWRKVEISIAVLNKFDGWN